MCLKSWNIIKIDRQSFNVVIDLAIYAKVVTFGNAIYLGCEVRFKTCASVPSWNVAHNNATTYTGTANNSL